MSRIETGKNRPNKNNFKKLTIKQGLPRGIAGVALDTEDFRVFEWAKESARSFEEGKLDKVRAVFGKVENSNLSDNIANHQFLEIKNILLEKLEGSITNEEALNLYDKALRLTFPEYAQKTLVSHVLTMREVNILNQMSIIHEANEEIRQDCAELSLEINQFCEEYDSYEYTTIMESKDENLELI